MSWDPNASRTRYPAQAGMALLGSQARVGRFACFYPPEAAARARSELELKIAAVEGRFESEGWRGAHRLLAILGAPGSA
jgi:hypothetical protein